MINTPTPIINTKIIDNNIDKMVALCKKWNMDFRPHFKTHQSAEIAHRLKKKGVEKCTVSSISMAQYFADHQWTDITIAIPVNILQIEEVNAIAERVKLHLLVDHRETCEFLCKNLRNKVGLFIEIDTAYGRSGVHHNNTKKADQLLQIIDSSPLLQFEGFLSHTGNNYSAENSENGARLFEESRLRMLQLKQQYVSKYPDLKISLGDTPSSTFAKDFMAIDEWRPGNFVFYDMMQYALGVCRMDEIAMVVRCPVIGIYPERKEFVIYGGGVHLSKESIVFQNQDIYGWHREETGEQVNELTGFPVISLSQEHGIIAASVEYLAQLKIGDLVDIIPAHSCMAADLYTSYFTEDGQVIDKFRGL